MKHTLNIFLLLLSTTSFAQTLTRKNYDYSKLKFDTISKCDEKIIAKLESALNSIAENNSSTAVNISKRIYQSNKNCPQIFDVYGYSQFRNGQWFEGIEIIENGIEKFGKIPELIKRRSDMSLEMAMLGTGQKNIDGNSVYKANSLKYNEEQFKNENLKSALKDLEYLEQEYNRSEETFTLGQINQQLEKYSISTKYFEKLTTDEKYKFDAQYNIAENYIQLKNYKEGEKILLNLLLELPKEGELYNKLSELKKLEGDTIASKEYRQKSIYYKNIPDFLNTVFSKEEYDKLILFGDESNSAKSKLDYLEKQFAKNENSKTIELCIIILKLHANHGNGVEERATEILSNIGKPSLDMVHKLFQTDVSTCTITNLADIMATIKDTSSWNYLKEYLPYIAKMPTTLIPPSVPEMIIKYDENRGVKEILSVVKPLLLETEKDNQFGGFGLYAYYLPLEKIDIEKIREVALELNYSKEELKILEEKIKK